MRVPQSLAGRAPRRRACRPAGRDSPTRSSASASRSRRSTRAPERHRPARGRPGARDRGAHRVQEADPVCQVDVGDAETEPARHHLRRHQLRRRRPRGRRAARRGAARRVRDHRAQDLRARLRRHDLLGARARASATTTPASWCCPPGTAEPGDDALAAARAGRPGHRAGVTPDRGYASPCAGWPASSPCALDVDYADPAAGSTVPGGRGRRLAGRARPTPAARGSWPAGSTASTRPRRRRGGCSAGCWPPGCGRSR